MLDAMPAGSEIEQRDRALVAFAILSGARDRAIVFFKLKYIDIESELIEQDARQVRTKRAKTFTTWFFPVGEDIRNIFVDWMAYLREKKGFGPEEPLFPKSRTISSRGAFSNRPNRPRCHVHVFPGRSRSRPRFVVFPRRNDRAESRAPPGSFGSARRPAIAP